MEREGGGAYSDFNEIDNNFERSGLAKKTSTHLSTPLVSSTDRDPDDQNCLEQIILHDSELVFDFSSQQIGESNNCYLGDMSLSSHQDMSFMNELSFNENNSYVSFGYDQANSNHVQRSLEVEGEEEIIKEGENSKGEERLIMKEGENYKESNKRLKTNDIDLFKGQWIEEEDRKLIKLVEQLGEKKWTEIAAHLDRRTGKQCRERWHNHLKPYIKRESWTEEEERMLVEAHSELGNRWVQIAKIIPGRTENSVKNHWNTTKRRVLNSMRKHRHRRHHYQQRTSILQDYIKSLLQKVGNNDAPTLYEGSSSQSGFSVIPEVGQGSQLPVQVNPGIWEGDLLFNPSYTLPPTLSEGPSSQSGFGVIPEMALIPEPELVNQHSLGLTGSEGLTTVGAENYMQIPAEPFSANQPNYFSSSTNLPNPFDQMLKNGIKSNDGIPNWCWNRELDEFVKMGFSSGSSTRFFQGGSSSGSGSGSGLW